MGNGPKPVPRCHKVVNVNHNRKRKEDSLRFSFGQYLLSMARGGRQLKLETSRTHLNIICAFSIVSIDGDKLITVY